MSKRSKSTSSSRHRLNGSALGIEDFQNDFVSKWSSSSSSSSTIRKGLVYGRDGRRVLNEGTADSSTLLRSSSTMAAARSRPDLSMDTSTAVTSNPKKRKKEFPLTANATTMSTLDIGGVDRTAVRQNHGKVLKRRAGGTGVDEGCRHAGTEIGGPKIGKIYSHKKPRQTVSRRDEGRVYKAKNSMVHFQVTDEAPILTLIEGISSAERPMTTGNPRHQHIAVVSPSWSSRTALGEYRKCLAQSLRPRGCPRSGRMIELPSVAMLGRWTAEMTKQEDDDDGCDHDEREQQRMQLATSRKQTKESLPSAVLKEMLEGDQSEGDDLLRGYRMLLRHESYITMGPLWAEEMIVEGPGSNTVNKVEGMGGKESQDDYIGDHPDPHRRRDHRNEKGTAFYESLVVTTLYPLKNRGPEIDIQKAGLLPTKGTRSSKPVSHYETFIGSISCVGFRGFNSINEMNEQAQDVAANLLKSARGHLCSGGVNDGVEELGNKENDLGIPFPSLCEVIGGDRGRNKPRPSIGASLLCGLSLDSDYCVMIAQDQNQLNNPIVAVDIVFDEGASRSSSPVESAGELLSKLELLQEGGNAHFLPLTERSLQDHSSQFLRDHFDTLDRLGDDSPDLGEHVYAQKTRPARKGGSAEGGDATIEKDDHAKPTTDSTVITQKFEVGFASSNKVNLRGNERQEHDQEVVPSSQFQQGHDPSNLNAKEEISAIYCHPKECAGAKSIGVDRDVSTSMTARGTEDGKIQAKRSRPERDRTRDSFVQKPKSLLKDFNIAASNGKDKTIVRPTDNRNVPKSAHEESRKTVTMPPPKQSTSNSKVRRISLEPHCVEQQRGSSQRISKGGVDNECRRDEQKREPSKINSKGVDNGYQPIQSRRSSSPSSSSSCWSEDWNFSCVSDNSQDSFGRRDCGVAETKEGAEKLGQGSRVVKSKSKSTSTGTNLLTNQIGTNRSKKNKAELGNSEPFDKASSSRMKSNREPLVERNFTRSVRTQPNAPGRLQPHHLALKQVRRRLSFPHDAPKSKKSNEINIPPPCREEEDYDERIRRTEFDLNSDDASADSGKENIEGFLLPTDTRPQRRQVAVRQTEPDTLSYSDMDNGWSVAETDLFDDAVSAVVQHRMLLPTSFAAIRLRMSCMTRSKAARWLLPVILLLTLAGGNPPMKVFHPISISSVPHLKNVSLPPPIHFVPQPFRDQEVYFSMRTE